jgi:Glycosyl transferases group 1
MGRILYICHDISAPRGGIGVIYDHVATLQANGFEAYIVHETKGFRYPFGPADIPILYTSGDGLSILESDTVVVPGDHMRAIHAFRNISCKKILFCQGHFSFFEGLNPGETWADFGFSDYLCVSEPTKQAMLKWFGVRASIVRPAIDDSYFTEKPLAPASVVSVACMPRRGADHLRLVAGLASTRAFAKSPPISWVVIDNLPRSEVPMRLREAHIYLSTSAREGLGLPPLEAMAAGCLVVGFTGGGGLDFATASNGIWVPDDDPWAMADSLLAAAIGLGDPNTSSILEAKRLAAQQTALVYRRSRFEYDLKTFWANKVN